MPVLQEGQSPALANVPGPVFPDLPMTSPEMSQPSEDDATPEMLDPKLRAKVQVELTPLSTPSPPPPPPREVSTRKLRQGTTIDEVRLPDRPLAILDAEIEYTPEGNQIISRCLPGSAPATLTRGPGPWLTGELARDNRQTEVLPPNPDNTASWELRQAMFMGLQFLRRIVMDVQQGDGNSTKRYFAFLRGGCTDREDQPLVIRGPTVGTYRHIVTLIRVDNHLLGLVETMQQVRVWDCHQDRHPDLLKSCVRKAMAAAYDVVIPHRNLRVLSIPPRPNHLDRYLLLLFLLREAIDPSAEQLSVAPPLRLRVAMANHLAVGLYRVEQWPPLDNLDMTGHLRPWVPQTLPSTLVAQRGTDMPGGSGDIECVPGRAPLVPPTPVFASHYQRVCVPEYLHHEADVLRSNFVWSRAPVAGQVQLLAQRRHFDRQLQDLYTWFLDENTRIRAAADATVADAQRLAEQEDRESPPLSAFRRRLQAAARNAARTRHLAVFSDHRRQCLVRLWEGTERATTGFRGRLLDIVRVYSVDQRPPDELCPHVRRDFSRELDGLRYPALPNCSVFKWIYTKEVPRTAPPL